MNLTEKVGKKIKEIRLKKGITQEELAFKADLEQSQIYRLENGKRRFNADQLEKISEVLDVPVINFFEGNVVFDDEINNQQLLQLITQIQPSKRKVLLNFIRFLQDMDEDYFDVKVFQKMVEAIKLLKK